MKEEEEVTEEEEEMMCKTYFSIYGDSYVYSELGYTHAKVDFPSSTFFHELLFCIQIIKISCLQFMPPRLMFFFCLFVCF